jgi:phytoene dehydrogenase-like protein
MAKGAIRLAPQSIELGSLKHVHASRLLEQWGRFAPNLHRDIIKDQFSLHPLDTESTLPNMHRGDLLVGSFSRGQVGHNRPFIGAGCYRTSVPGLYLCGGSTHPGGNITGLCGYNAARVVAADVGAKIWWNPPDAAEALASL